MMIPGDIFGYHNQMLPASRGWGQRCCSTPRSVQDSFPPRKDVAPSVDRTLCHEGHILYLLLSKLIAVSHHRLLSI